MKNISVTDLKLVSTLSHLNYVEMIDPANHHLVIPVLETIGMDTDYPIVVSAYQHRTMQNKVVVNFIFSGELQINRNFLTSEWASLEDILIASNFTDRSLHKELCQLSGTQSSYETCHSLSTDENAEIINILNNYQDVEECARVTNEIKLLNDIIYQVRGDQMLPSGAYKLWQEYHQEFEHKPFFRRKSVKKNKNRELHQ